MKLASLNDGSRDGQLVVVSRDLLTAHHASAIAGRLQQVLDDWNFLSPQLEDLYQTLNQGKARHAFAFDPRNCLAPLPRAFAWAQAWPLGTDEENRGRTTETRSVVMQVGSSNGFLGPCEPVLLPSDRLGIHFGAGLAVVSGDLPQGLGPDRALDAVRLLMLSNTTQLHSLMAAERARGGSLVHSLPATSFGPVAVTPDELGPAWAQGRLQLKLEVAWNGKRAATCDAAGGMPHHFGELMAHLARTQRLRAGSVVGSGPLPGSEVAPGQRGMAEKRARSNASNPTEPSTTTATVTASTPSPTEEQAATNFMALGDSLRLEVKGLDGQSVFGAIDLVVSDGHDGGEGEAGDGTDGGNGRKPA